MSTGLLELFDQAVTAKPTGVDALYWRFAIRTASKYVEIDYPSGATLAEATRVALGWYGDGVVVEPMITLEEARATPDDYRFTRIVVFPGNKAA